MRGLLGKKIGMTQIFDSEGFLLPVTVIKAGPCFVTQIKTNEIDGYFSIQAGFEDATEKHVNNPQSGHFKKANISPKKYLAEFKPVKFFEYKKGQMFSVSIFKKGEFVDIRGITKGRVFLGDEKTRFWWWPKNMVKESTQGRLDQSVRLLTLKSF